MSNPEITAHTIALLVRGISLDEAAKLIQNFADVTASTAALKAAEDQHARITRIVDSALATPMVRT